MPRNLNLTSAANVLYEIIHEYKNRSIQVCFVKVRDSLAELFHRAGLLQLVEGNNYQKIHEAVAALSSQTRSPSVQESPSIESYDELLQYRQYSRNS